MKHYGWDAEHPDYPKKDWKYEVANDDTLIGYDEWVASKTGEAERWVCDECEETCPDQSKSLLGDYHKKSCSLYLEPDE